MGITEGQSAAKRKAAKSVAIGSQQPRSGKNGRYLTHGS
jgi:hypothetical protein